MPRLTLIILLHLVPHLHAQDEAKVDVKRFAIHPAAAPTPALKHRLTPEARDLTQGNAALLYQRAQSPEFVNGLQKAVFDKWDRFDVPLDKFPIKDADQALAFRGVLQEIDHAARRTTCDWELLDRLRREGVTMLLPELQTLRQIGRLNALRTRRALYIAKFGEALHSLQTGLTMGRHVAEGPTLVHFLVGAAIVNQQLAPLDDWIKMPTAPNLYWALTDLPRPGLSMRSNLDSEQILIDSLFPGVRDALRDPAAPPPSLEVLRKSMKQMPLLDGKFSSNLLGEAWLALKVYPVAKTYLKGRGRTDAQIEAIGIPTAVVMYMVGMHDQYFDDIAKWIRLPYWEAAPGLQRADQAIQAARKDQGATLATLLLPNVSSVALAQARSERRIAVLRAVEALRLHAAEKGELPATWDAVTSVPPPVDPITGKLFPYRVANGLAVLTVAPPPGSPDRELRYELELKRR